MSKALGRQTVGQWTYLNVSTRRPLCQGGVQDDLVNPDVVMGVVPLPGIGH
jgi:hypothetical protein